jgi:DNA-directed RNA polymerase subunit K/omega
MPSKRQNKEVENIVVENEFVDITPVDVVSMNDEDVENGEEAGEDVVEEDDDHSSIEDEDEGDFGVEKDEEDDDDENGHPVDDDEDDEDEEEEEDDEGELNEENDGEEDEGPSVSKKQKGGVGKAKGKKAKDAPQPEEEAVQYGIDSDDDEDVEFEKFEEETREQYLLNFHPESRAVNFDEVKSLCTVIRDSDGDIIDDFHTTIPILTKYEKARILGMRAKQLNSNIRPMIPIPDYVIDSYRIAEMELEAKAIPFIIKRPLPDGRSEYWRAQDLTCVY